MGVKDLSMAATDVRPVDYDWSEGYGEKWESVEAEDCPECGKGIVTTCNPECTKCEWREEDSFSGPMMNYFYELPGFSGDMEEAAIKIIHLPLCIVHFTEDRNVDYALALTGGGMDLSWEICGAYVALGYIPPLHFSFLPRYAGKTLTKTTRLILSALQYGLQWEARNAAGRVKGIKEMRRELWKNTMLASLKRKEAVREGTLRESLYRW